MSTKSGILSIDQGTTSTRAIVFALDGTKIASAQKEFTQFYPYNGWVEHDPEEIWKTTVETCKSALHQAQEKGVRVVGIGITNQRETTLVWNRETGKPIYNAIVWQDRRTAAFCNSNSNATPFFFSRECVSVIACSQTPTASIITK